MRLVCDTNVLLRAAINPNGLAGALLRRIRASHQLIASVPLMTEFLAVIRRPKVRALHGRDERGIRRLVSALYKAATIVSIPPPPLPRIVPRDPKDDAIVLTAIGGKADVLTTRDKHFFDPDVTKFVAGHAMRIIEDDELLAELEKE